MRATETAVLSDADERMPKRGAYRVGLDTCCMVEVDPERFEVMVSEALDGIPAELGELTSNVAVTVQQEVIHEVGHHFGIGDARLRELGW